MVREPLAPAPPSPDQSGPRHWRGEFRDAVRGLKLGARGHSRLAVHVFVAAAAAAAGVALQCRLWEWCLILLCAGAVFTAELFHASIDALYRSLGPDVRPASNAGRHISAGAALTASLVGLLVGFLVFVNRLGELMKWWNDQ